MAFRSNKLSLEVIWLDIHMLELKLCAANTHFSGQTTFYASLDAPAQFANHIRGFPNSHLDYREYEFGGTGLDGHGGAKVKLSCTDSSGHLLVEVNVYNQSGPTEESIQSATVHNVAVPAEIDSFVEQLLSIRQQVGDTAYF